ncbi:hypothetical protein EJ02DRAFT_453088 [Clathrospora elynae]|uniref:Uncharacterized protein n=1 Tax=Clathrospora elynae TaxID=706981 RepID=A0A6A5STX5_9PLEO|nr:hypothetical protein EJ02DRAFT_453088 [Clathrospora elynae]
MAATAIASTYSLDRQQRLLHLDCSADLRPYSRSLGPGVQERIFQTTSDALRAQLDEHRDFLLRHQQQAQPHLSHPPVLSPPTTIPLHSHILPPNHYHQPAQPQPSQAAPPPKPTQSRQVYDLVPPITTTYPPALHEALGECTRIHLAQNIISRTRDGRATYNVMFEIGDRYERGGAVDTRCDTVETYQSMSKANNFAAQCFVIKFSGRDLRRGIFQARDNGALHCEIETEEGRVRVFVKEGRMEMEEWEVEGLGG